MTRAWRWVKTLKRCRQKVDFTFEFHVCSPIALVGWPTTPSFCAPMQVQLSKPGTIVKCCMNRRMNSGLRKSRREEGPDGGRGKRAAGTEQRKGIVVAVDLKDGSKPFRTNRSSSRVSKSPKLCHAPYYYFSLLSSLPWRCLRELWWRLR